MYVYKENVQSDGSIGKIEVENFGITNSGKVFSDEFTYWWINEADFK